MTKYNIGDIIRLKNSEGFFEVVGETDNWDFKYRVDDGRGFNELVRVHDMVLITSCKHRKDQKFYT